MNIKFILIVLFLVYPINLFAQDSLLPTLRKYRNEYGATPTKEQIGKILNSTAWEHRQDGWALLGKKDGTNCPRGNELISCDFLIHIPTMKGFDVLINIDGPATPTWGSPSDMSNAIKNKSRTIVLPIGVDDTPVEDQRDEEIRNLKAHITQLDIHILQLGEAVEIRDNIINNSEERIDALNSIIENLRAQPSLSCRVVPFWVSLFGIRCEVE